MQRCGIFLIGCCLGACFAKRGPFFRAEKFLKKGLCQESAIAFSNLPKIGAREKAFVQKAARSCQNRGAWSASLFFYEVLLKEEPDPQAAREIQKTAAHTAFYKLKNYETALRHYEALFKTARSLTEKFDIGYQKAKCFSRLGKNSQALWEVEQILTFFGVSKKQALKAVLLKASLLTSLEQYDKAVPFLKKGILEYPEKKDFFHRYLAFIFEKRGNILLSLKELEKMRPGGAFLRKKIQFLKNRMENRPGGGL